MTAAADRLEVEGRTLLSHRATRGRLELPEDDLVAMLYEETVAFLDGRGIKRYEISNRCPASVCPPTASGAAAVQRSLPGLRLR